jgi:uncharacterized protein (DUF305 family)
MKQTAILYGIVGLFGGILLTILFTSNVVNSNNTSMMKMMGINTTNNNQMMRDAEEKNDNKHTMPDGSLMMNMSEGMTMDDMVNNLKGKTGDSFDKAFISGMIEHHQGAIDMANLAKQYAKHDEIKSMADDIISAQTNEITQMREWQKNWGY